MSCSRRYLKDKRIGSGDDERVGSISAQQHSLDGNPWLRLVNGNAAATAEHRLAVWFNILARDHLSLASRFGRAMYSDALFDELRQVERDVVDGERQLTEQEALLRDLKSKNLDTIRAGAELALMREAQQRRQTERHRLLSLLQP